MIIVFILSGCRRRHFRVDFPLSDVFRNLTLVALDFLKTSSQRHEGLTWQDAFDYIPPSIWRKYGFHSTDSDSESICINAIGENYLIPSYAARLMEITTYMTTYLMEYFEIDPLHDLYVKLMDRITDFIVIWAPRFVDTDAIDANEFIENALADTEADFWAFDEEDNCVESQKRDLYDNYTSCL